MIHASRITNEYNRSTSSPYPFPTNKHYIDGQELTFKQPVNDRVEIDLRRRIRHGHVSSEYVAGVEGGLRVVGLVKRQGRALAREIWESGGVGCAVAL